MLKPSNMPSECQKAMMGRKYGMFIHFGINTFNDTEWSNGKLPISSYKPTEIDAEQWVRNAYELGMNYVILITKHHDGFCLWDTDTTDYCVNKSPNKTDVVAEVRKACDKYGIKLGLYYSLWDRHEKSYHKFYNHAKYNEYMAKQLTELMTRYGDICEIWLDGGWDKLGKNWDLPMLYDLVKKYQPNCAFGVNCTIGEPNKRGFTPDKYKAPHYKEGMPIKYFPSDFRLDDPNSTILPDPKLYEHNGEMYYMPFEATICIRNMKNWFWDPKYTEDKLLDVDFIINSYKNTTENDNVLVVNVAPNIYGKQEQSDIDRLMEASKVLGINRV